MQFSQCHCPDSPPGGTGIIPDIAVIGKNCLSSGSAQFTAVRSVENKSHTKKFYTFLIIQINIILHYCVLRISVSLIGGAAAHPLKPPLVSTELYAISWHPFYAVLEHLKNIKQKTRDRIVNLATVSVKWRYLVTLNYKQQDRATISPRGNHRPHLLLNGRTWSTWRLRRQRALEVWCRQWQRW